MNFRPLLAAALLLALATPAPAQSSDVISLTPEQREAALEAAASRPVGELPINGLPKAVHGEVGMEIGTNGTRALYGTALVPLGDSGSAAFSFFNGRTGRWH